MNKCILVVLLFCVCVSLLGIVQVVGMLIGQVGVQMVIGVGCIIINGSVSGGINQWGILDFGSYFDFINVVDVQIVGISGNIQIQCSIGLILSLMVNVGLYVSGGQCYMQNIIIISSIIVYNIYLDVVCSVLIQVNILVDIFLVFIGIVVNIFFYGCVVFIG